MSGSTDSRYELARVALGEANADLAIVNGDLVNVYTGELLHDTTVLIKGKWIAYTGRYPKKGIGPGTQVIDARGQILIPGFIDGHTHTDYIYSSSELARYALRTGTTTIITDAVELTFALGYPGLKEFIRSVTNQPVKFYITLPPMVTISPVARQHILSDKEIRRLLHRKDVIGLGEIYWGPLLADSETYFNRVNATLEMGKRVEGHGAGASGSKLQAYTSLGITSDHEPITPEEALERLRLGLSVMMREGEIRQDLEALSPLKDQKIDFRRLSLSTDGVGPIQLVSQGLMDHLVRKAIKLGFPPVQAIQMATLNVAEHFHLDDFIGGIAPGRYADIVIIPDLSSVQPGTVISNGEIVLENGQTRVRIRQHHYAAFTRFSINLPEKLPASAFTVKVHPAADQAKVRVIDQITNLLTREVILDLPVIGDEIKADPGKDIIKVASIERRHTPGKIFTGFIRGLGLREGAIATSTCWDSTDLIVVGTDEEDMAQAVQRIRELGGGTVICRNRKILSEVPFEIGGMVSPAPMELLAGRLSTLQTTAVQLGCLSPDIRTTLSVLTTAAIPFLRICESGLFDLRSNQIVNLIIR